MRNKGECVFFSFCCFAYFSLCYDKLSLCLSRRVKATAGARNRKTRMTTFIKTKFKISDDQTNIDKYR